ncbi:hypothetical protein GmRootV213_39690 [Variovorax sp. V213]
MHTPAVCWISDPRRRNGRDWRVHGPIPKQLGADAAPSLCDGGTSGSKGRRARKMARETRYPTPCTREQADVLLGKKIQASPFVSIQEFTHFGEGLGFCGQISR